MEILLVDDASGDGTADAVRQSHPQVKVLRQPRRSGFAASANRGLSEAEGTVLLALNSDTELLPGSFDALLSRFEQNQLLGIAGASLSYPGGGPQWSGGRQPDLLWLLAVASGLPPLLARLPGWRKLRPVAGTASATVDWVTGAALAIRRTVWFAVGPFETAYGFYGQDLDLCSRARSAGWQVEIVPGFRVVHHHGATISREERSVASQNPVLLWPDLVRWAKRHRGGPWAARAAVALRLGGMLRLLGRWLREQSLPASARNEWRRDTRTYREALVAVRCAAADHEHAQLPGSDR